MLPKLETPTYTLTLPSTGDEIVYRPFLVKEHKVLLTLKGSDEKEVSRILKELINSCTFNKIDVDKLTFFDIEYFFINLRAKSIGEEVEVLVRCTNCEEQFDASFNLLDAQTINNNQNNNIKIDDVYGVVIKYPDLEEIAKMLNAEDEYDTVDLIIDSIEGVYTEEDYWDAKSSTREEIKEFIESLTQQQFKRIEEFYTNLPKIVLDFKSECTHCNHVNESRLNGLMNFFL